MNTTSAGRASATRTVIRIQRCPSLPDFPSEKRPYQSVLDPGNERDEWWVIG